MVWLSHRAAAQALRGEVWCGGVWCVRRVGVVCEEGGMREVCVEVWYVRGGWVVWCEGWCSDGRVV